MEETITFSRYDNQFSVLYKVANLFQTPVKYILIRDQSTASDVITYEEVVFVPLIGLVDTGDLGVYDGLKILFSSGDLPAIYQDNFEKTAVNPEEFTYLYFAAALSQEEVTSQQAFDTIQKFLGSDRFRDFSNFSVKYQYWIETILPDLYKRDLVTFNKIIQTQEDLESIPPEQILSAGQLVINRQTIRIIPIFQDGQPPHPADGPDLFNQAVVSYLVPYVQYNEAVLVGDETKLKKTYYKIFRGEGTFSADLGLPGIEPDLDLIIPPSRLTSKPNSLYLTVWSEVAREVVSRPTREGYLRATYDLDTGALIFKVVITEKTPEAVEEVIGRLQEALPSLSLESQEVIRISGYFDIWVTEPIKDYVLLHLILNDSTFTDYLYVDERQVAFPEKKRLRLHYRNLVDSDESTSLVSADLSNRIVSDEEATPEVPSGTPYLHVNINQATSEEEAEKFKQILTLLISLYQQKKDEIIPIYQTFIPEFSEEPPEESKGFSTIKMGKSRRNIYRLKDLAPDIFIEGYARKCLGKHQPIAIKPEEVEAWRAKRIINPVTNQLEPRQVMPFPPPPDDQILLVCPDDQNPYPGVKVNQLSNKDKYPYIPCCYKADQTIPGKKSNYNRYYHNLKTKGKEVKKRTKLITSKILSVGGIGEIPIPLENLLLRYSTDSKQFKRYGVIRDVNSLIHCVMAALNYQNYQQLSPDDKMELARMVRESIPEYIYPEVTKQELYNFSSEDINTQILNPNLFFDPSLFYRSLEEYFDVNIYTFSPGKKLKEEKEALGQLEIPRHKSFYSRPFRPDRSTILIYRHWGAEADALAYPQCELLVDYDPVGKTLVQVFDEAMTTLIQKTLLETYVTTNWLFQENSGAISLVSYENLFSKFNFPQILGGEAIAQFIDQYGKMTGLVINYDGLEMAVFFLPSQPENLPLAEEIPLVEPTEATRIFGEPNAYFKKDSVAGFWFPYTEIPDFPHLLFVPVTSIQDYPNLLEGPPPPVNLSPSQTETIDRVLRLQRTISFLLQIIAWLFLIAYRQGYSVKEFMDTFQRIYQSPVTDSADFYDLSKFPRKFPVVETVEAAITALEPLTPTLFQGGQVVFYSQRFADKIKAYLEKLQKQLADNPVTIPIYLEGYYDRPEDFRQDPFTVIIIGQDNFNTWLQSLEKASYRGIKVLTTLQSNLSGQTEPYIYLSADNVTYLVQNVSQGHRNQARQVAISWLTQLINLGYRADFYEEEIGFTEKVYNISPSAGLQLIEETPADLDDSIELLVYPDDTYAALLPVS